MISPRFYCVYWRSGAEEVTLLDGTGVGLQDLAVASAVIDLAFAKGVAIAVDF